MNQSVNDKAVYRTDLATPALLNILHTETTKCADISTDTKEYFKVQ